MGSNDGHLRFLDQLRGVAILAVFVFHCVYPAFGRDQLKWGRWFVDFSSAPESFLLILPATFGWAGVAVFFVVSGFCVHLNFVKGASPDWRSFFIRRFFRIYPPYLVALIAFAVFLPATKLTFLSRSDWFQLGSHALLVHNFHERTFMSINGAFWTIAIEAQLYLLYPLLLALVNRIGWKRALLILGGMEVSMRALKGFVISAMMGDVPHWFAASPLFFWYSWAIGAAIADAYARKQTLPFGSLSAGTFLALAIVSSFVLPLFPLSFLLFAVLTAIVLARFLQRDRESGLNGRFFSHLQFLGICSYSFYLWQQPFVAAVPVLLAAVADAPVHPLVVFASCVCVYPVVLGVSHLYFVCCERPSIALGKLLMRRTPVPALRFR